MPHTTFHNPSCVMLMAQKVRQSSMQRFATFLLLGSIAALAPASSHAEPCDPALVHDLPSLVPFSSVSTMTSWDPDRDGPLGERLVIAGDFTVSSVPNFHRIAAWDGAQWSTFGQGLNSAPTALASIFGKLIVYGPEIRPIGRPSLGNMAQWNGTTWQTLPGGSVTGSVNTMKVLGDWLYVGGSFSNAGGQNAANIARWNGITWQKLGNGLNGPITSLEVFDGQLVACGEFSSSGSDSVRYVARWDGQAWRPFGDGPGDFVYSSTIHNGQLVVNSGALMGWNGTEWDLLSSEALWNLPFIRSVNGKLYAAGYLDTWEDGPGHILSILSWDGVKWSNMHGGLLQGGSAARISCLGEFGGDLYAMGQLTHAGGAPTPGIARWTGTTWRSIGSGWSKYGVAKILPATNAFYAVDIADHPTIRHEQEWLSLPPPPASSPDVDKDFFVVEDALHAVVYDYSKINVLRFQGGGWLQIGESFSSAVQGLLDFNGDIIARGQFTTVSGLPARGIARWNGSQWLPMGTNFSAASLAVYQDQLYAIGQFVQSASSTSRDFARWDGTTWIALNIGDAPDGRLMTYRNQIIAVGYKSLFAWSGTSWSTISSPVSGVIESATIFGGRLIAGGYNIGAPGVSLAQWAGSEWRTFGPSVSFRLSSPGYIFAVAVFGDALLIGGDFDHVGSAEAYNFARISACSLCPSDLTNDAIVDDADFCDFILSYDLMDCSDPAMHASCPADFNADGLVDDTDFTRFVIDYAAFLCPEPS
jgi:hypothetical protein